MHLLARLFVAGAAEGSSYYAYELLLGSCCVAVCYGLSAVFCAGESEENFALITARCRSRAQLAPGSIKRQSDCTFPRVRQGHGGRKFAAGTISN